MAFNIKRPTSLGIDANYWKITGTEFSRHNQVAIIHLAGWTDVEARRNYPLNPLVEIPIEFSKEIVSRLINENARLGGLSNTDWQQQWNADITFNLDLDNQIEEVPDGPDHDQQVADLEKTRCTVPEFTFAPSFDPNLRAFDFSDKDTLEPQFYDKIKALEDFQEAKDC